MRAHELFRSMSPALAADVFVFLQKEQKPVYKAAIQGLATQRNLRSVFIERKPPNERYPWMQAALSRPISDALASHLIQGWLLGANKAMLCDFLDALEIAHEVDGTVEELPPCPPKEQIKGAVAVLLQKYPTEAVAVYLHAFRDMDSSVQWPALNEILTEMPKLQFAPREGG
ncbi:MAG: hypothetical protein M3372_03145 [Verrucomicrobiota bacterium]|nr:hypothetical protein [Chthoniobacterales bacterium]MDQ3626111.1 hypothetical protein [Verrucomicrobiota bacterium]